MNCIGGVKIKLKIIFILLVMAVNVFGSSGGYTDIDKNNLVQHVDSKFITLAKNLNTKVNKSGDTMSGELNMGNNKITDLSAPISDNDATNKKFVDLKLH